jgi:hypothetical protein
VTCLRTSLQRKGQITFTISVLSSNKPQHVSITKISWLMLFKEIIAVYNKNRAKILNVKMGVT